ncbi:MAG: hypothetical protein WA116_07415 [Anaerolineaceae bacterium]
MTKQIYGFYTPNLGWGYFLPGTCLDNFLAWHSHGKSHQQSDGKIKYYPSLRRKVEVNFPQRRNTLFGKL